MDSVDALDLLYLARTLLRTKKEASLDFLAKMKEQILRHRFALRHIIGPEKLKEINL
jgi:hypothetical protein